MFAGPFTLFMEFQHTQLLVNSRLWPKRRKNGLSEGYQRGEQSHWLSRRIVGNLLEDSFIRLSCAQFTGASVHALKSQVLALAFALLSLVSPAVAGNSRSVQPIQTDPVPIEGRNYQWTKIATVQANTLIQVKADGQVYFRLGSDDDAVAGVEGQMFRGSWFQNLRDMCGYGWEEKIVNPSRYPHLVRCVFTTKQRVNYNQGGLWIKVVYRDGGQPVIPTQLFYYWQNIYNKPGFACAKDVIVYAKAHDGGKDADKFRAGDYSNNRGCYRVWLSVTRRKSIVWAFN
jgi:hypothetical protein